MKNNEKQLVFLRAYALFTVIGFFALISIAFNPSSNRRFGTIDVERINIIEKDGTVKMLITNVENFPGAEDTINGRPNHGVRKKTAGMLFYNDEGIECGGLIYGGAKTDDGHDAGLSLTFDQYDGDQVMQLLTTDESIKGKRYKRGGLMFNERPDKETQIGMINIINELSTISNEQERAKKLQEYKEQGLIGSSPRIYLGHSQGRNSGLFLFDSKGNPKAKFYVDSNNKAKLEVLDENGKVISSWPE
ncbi:hypothetical protein EYV94_03055 [Puteibacter caeruleilacunae]|nr:hypothetical protein EYV94_03055 [Puteibacter caeruleilacunae]